MGRKGKKGKAARNAQATQVGDSKDDEYQKAPHSFVIHRGHVGKTVKELVLDVRKIMEPYTAANLRVRKKNVMKDFLTIAGPLHVSHFIVFTKTDIATYMKLICVPRGPTLTFKVNEFSLARDVLSFQKHPDLDSKLFVNHAVMVTNIPSDTMENKLMNVTFKNMFPSINPNTVKLNKMRRSVMVNYDSESKTVDLRHYTMKVVPTGVSRAMKKLMKPKLPDLGHHEDIADLFMEKGLSDSEGEQDGPHNQVTVTQHIKGRGVTKNAVNAIRLKEIGPRLTMQLIKIEEGFEGGNVLYHALVQKTPEEMEALKAMRQNKEKEKLARKQRQEANIRKKKADKEKQVQQTLEGMKKKKQKEAGTEEDSDKEGNEVAEKDEQDDEDDDAAYFKQEVGEEPEPEMFSQGRKRKRAERDTKRESNPKRSRKFEDKKRNESPGKMSGKLLKNKKDNKKFSVKFSQKMDKSRKGVKVASKGRQGGMGGKGKKPGFKQQKGKRR